MKQEIFWEHHQGKGGHDDGVFSGSGARYAFLAKEIPKGVSILNIGVGRGGLEDLLGEKGATVYCLDPGEAAINRLSKESGLGDWARVELCQQIPFDDASFDVVIMSEVLEHLSSEDITSTRLEIRRVLFPSGPSLGTAPFREILAETLAFWARLE